MSVNIPCTCIPRDRSGWVVQMRNCNYSYFESPKGLKHFSEYSAVLCKKCGGTWRTKAKYVNELPDEI
ncbi:MAG: hypothetical protein ACTSQ8_25835 [Candidatus Helarchaeota archaeon]